jgi:acyl-coenzyme A synthetase/AMP-(fatty) acid ligase
MNSEYPLTSDDIYFQKTSISFVDAVCEIFSPLVAGARLFLPTQQTIDVETLALAIQRTGATRLVGVPSLLRSIASFFASERRILTSVRVLISSGEALDSTLLKKIKAVVNPECIILNLYGSSEVAADATCCRVCASTTAVVPIGRPIANTRIYLLDGFGQPVPVGVPGEIYVGGAGLARGYLNRQELTAERFVPDPFGHNSEERLYRTGDLARYLPDGNIEYLGRTDHQVKIRGFRIELGEIESVLAAHPAILENVVIAREDAPGEKRLAGYIVVRPGLPAPTNAELRRNLAVQLPEYMIPSAFVVLERMPLTLNGKINRQALPPPDLERPQLDHAYVAPRTPAELAMAEIWRAVLQIDLVGVNDNFFQLGGHSLLAARVIARLRSVQRIEVPLHWIFDFPTIASLTDRISKNTRVHLGISA